MTLADRFKINTSKVVHETIDNEVIIINFDNGNYYSLNTVGAEIWSCIERNPTVNEIINVITNRYEGNPEVIKQDVTQLITDLKREELIVLEGEQKDQSHQESNSKLEINESKERPKFEKPGLNKYTDMQEMLLLDPIHEVDETGWPTSKREPK